METITFGRISSSFVQNLLLWGDIKTDICSSNQSSCMDLCTSITYFGSKHKDLLAQKTVLVVDGIVDQMEFIFGMKRINTLFIFMA